MRMSFLVASLAAVACTTVPSEHASGRAAAGLSSASTPLGNLVITEIMRDPSSVLDSRGEWFEVTNTIAADIDMQGVQVTDSAGSGFTVSTSLVVPAGESVVLGRNGDTVVNGGVALDYDWPGSFSLGNGSDDIQLLLGSVLLDSVSWDGGATFPAVAGAAMVLDTGARDALSNDDGARWCAATTELSSGDFGTPGAANPACDGTLVPPLSIDDVVVGDLIITEILQDPSAVTDARGEWFELHNTTLERIDLRGLDVEDSAGKGFSVDESVVVEAGGYVVFGQSADTSINGGVPVDFAWSGTFSLGNKNDDVQLHNAAGLLDAVAYTESYVWGDPTGASLTLDRAAFDPARNDVGGQWCEGETAYGDGDLGTPGAANPSCPLDVDGDGVTIADGDCDDEDDEMFPGNVELCDGIDNDCNGAADSSVPGDYYTVEHALMYVDDGEVVCIGAGTHEGPFEIDGKSVVLRGEGVGETILSGERGGSVVRFTNGSEQPSGLEDLTIELGEAEQGAGLYIDAASPSIRRVEVTGNGCVDEVDCEGAGVWMRDSAATFEDVEFHYNQAYAYDTWTTSHTFTGGTVYMESSSPTFRDVSFTSGYVRPSMSSSLNNQIQGGVVAVLDGSTPVFDHVRFEDNWVHQSSWSDADVDGGVVYITGDSDVRMSHVEAFDSAWSGEQLRGGFAYVGDGSGLSIHNGVLANNNSNGHFSDIWGGLFYVGEGTETVDLESLTIAENHIEVNATGWSYADGFYVDCSAAGSTDVRLSHITMQTNGNTWASYVHSFFGSTGSHCADNVEAEYLNSYDNGPWSGFDPTTTTGFTTVDSEFRSVWTSASAADWDLTLKTLSALSDAGDPTRTDGDGSRMDVGAYGGEDSADW